MSIYISDEQLEAIESARGFETRSSWIGRVLAAELQLPKPKLRELDVDKMASSPVPESKPTSVRPPLVRGAKESAVDFNIRKANARRAAG